jgi:glucose/arabinose dehydrogenase
MMRLSYRVVRWIELSAAVVVMSVAAVAQQNQPQNIGVAPVVLTSESYTFDTAEQHKIRVVVVAKGLVHPFSLAMLPNGDALITERGVRLRIVRNATGRGATLDPGAVAGVPQPPTFRGGGLLDVVPHPKFATNGLVYFTYNKTNAVAATPAQQQAAIALARGRFDGKTITELKEIFAGELKSGSSGSRIAFSSDGLLYMTTGAPFGQEAQNGNSVYGKVLRLRDDGTVPPDNPFVGKAGWRPEVFSYGHRDQLGLTVHEATGAVLAAEHGPNGGDEVNVISPGRNYGWPKFSFGRTYEGPRISDSCVEGQSLRRQLTSRRSAAYRRAGACGRQRPAGRAAA